MSTPDTKMFFHEPTSTFSYVVWDPETRKGAVIDPVLDYDAPSGRRGTGSATKIVDFVREGGIHLDWVLETHAHADHLSAAPFVKSRLGGRICIGEGIRAVQGRFKRLFNLGDEFQLDGGQFDRLFADEEAFKVGSIEARAIPTPGHTSDSLTYLIGDAGFVGDSLFMPDAGTARCDFRGGDAHVLWRSTRRLFDLPEETRLFMCHDYAPGGREVRNETTVGEQKRTNIHVRRPLRGRVRAHASRARRHAGHAETDPAIGAAQHPRRQRAAPGGKWSLLPEDPPGSIVG